MSRSESSPLPVLPMVVYAIAGACFALPIARVPSVLATAIGASLGALAGARLARSTLRAAMFPWVAILGALVARSADVLVASFDAVPRIVGADRAIGFGDALSFSLGAFFVVAALRALTERRRAFAILEVLAVGLAATSLVVGHRNGAINRPFELADPILASGGDPSALFLAIGGVAAALVALLLMRERNAWRGLLHFGFALALMFLLVATTRHFGLPTPPSLGGGVGLRGESGRGNQRNGQGGHPPREADPDFDSPPPRHDGAPPPVAVVVFHDEYVPPSGVYYFRQGAISHFNGHKLVASYANGVDDDVSATFPYGPTPVSDSPPASSSRRELTTTVALLAEHARPFGLESPIRFAPARNPDPSRFRRAYFVTSRALIADVTELLGHAPGKPSWDEATWREYTERPSDPRYDELAQRIVEEDLPVELRSEPLARVAAIVGWLGHEGTYSLESRHARGNDPAGDFLFGDKIGYCVHFAHAATYMMRSLGIPTRIATGYMVDASARQGGSALVLTDAMAHAWPEVYFEGYGWVVADVYPERSLSSPPENVDRDLQRLLGEMARGEQPLPEDTPGVVHPDVARWTRAILAALGTFLSYGLPWLLACLYGVKLYRRLAPRFARRSQLARLAYRAELDRLAELGFRRERGESREAFARRIAGEVPSFVDVTRAHVGATYGSAAAARSIDGLSNASRELSRELGHARSLLRRCLAFVDPISFLFSR